MPVSPRTRSLETLLSKIADAGAGRRYFVGGGFAIDLSLGRLSRDHEDIDLFVESGDISWWRSTFSAWGHAIGQDSDMRFFPGAFTVDGDLIEVWPIEWRAEGTLVPQYAADYPGRVWWAGMRQAGLRQVAFSGAEIWIEDPETAIDRKLGHVRHHRERLLAKHVSDIRLMGRISEYERLIAELGL